MKLPGLCRCYVAPKHLQLRLPPLWRGAAGCLSYIEDLALALREDGKCSATPDDGAVQPIATGRWALWVFGEGGVH